ncbi:MAG: hypothetical protein JWM63_4029 [Gammaproteobacteria bacterium]|nr:hypothetical protein [Gammaproteobacteria bacterium]
MRIVGVPGNFQGEPCVAAVPYMFVVSRHAPVLR